MYDSGEFKEEGLYYILSSYNPNNSLSIINNSVEPYMQLNFSKFNDSFYQAFYFFKNEDNSYYIMNINSLKILGVENNINASPIIQNIISPSINYKWNIIKINYYGEEYFLELKFNNKRMDFLDNFVVINERNDYSNSQRFTFLKCIYNIPKSDLWNKWEKFLLREFIENQIYIIRSAQNDNIVFNFDFYNNNINLNCFNGNKDQLFFILKKDGDIWMIPLILFIKKGINLKNFIFNNRYLMKLKINKNFSDSNGIALYTISNENYLNLDTSYNSLNFNYSNGNISQKFYLSLVSSNIFRRYILSIFGNCNESVKNISLKYDYILDYCLDGFRNMTFLSIDKDTKFISDNAFKNMNTLKKIKINLEWIHKFNKKNIISIEFNDNISQLNLEELKDFINLNELNLPLSIYSIIGSYNLYIPKLKKLECDPKIIIVF